MTLSGRCDEVSVLAGLHDIVPTGFFFPAIVFEHASGCLPLKVFVAELIISLRTV
jgi:hypothetical protein